MIDAATTSEINDTPTLNGQATEPKENPVRRKPGAPKLNTNRTVHGLRGIGYPPGADNDRRLVQAFVRSLRAAMVAMGKPLDLPTVAAIGRAADHERHRRLCGREIRTGKNLTSDQRVAYSAQASEAAEKRDRVLRILGLNNSSTDHDPWAALNHQPQQTPITPPAEVGNTPD